jgi:hypothetical protein
LSGGTEACVSPMRFRLRGGLYLSPLLLTVFTREMIQATCNRRSDGR